MMFWMMIVILPKDSAAYR